MTSHENIEKKLEELAQSITPNGTLVEKVMSRIDTKHIAELSIRRFITNPFIKLSAAAVIIITTGIGIYYFTCGTTPAFGITDLPELFEQAKVIHIQGWNYFAGHRMPDGAEIPPAEIDNWIDLENGRSRYTGTGLSIDKNGVSVTTAETISDGQYQICLNHTERHATFFRISDYQRMLNAYLISKLMYGQIFGEIEQLQNFEKVGYEQIDEVVYDIWQRDTIHAVTEHANRFKFWISPNSGKLGRVQVWSKENDGQWELDNDYCDIEYNVVIPDGIFSMDIPQGYTSKNTKETAIASELGGGGGVGYSDDQYDLRANTLIGFMMGDGSVIAAWHSVNNKSQTPQEEFFKGLEFGGPLPKLPVEVYGLKPAGLSSDITYTGYHLTYTQKAGKFIEWSLYVPDRTPPASARKLGYDVLYRFNLDPEPKTTIGLTVDCNLLIESAKDFEKWVLEAMAELSDDGKAPADVSYERVLQLAERIKSKNN